MKRILLIIVLTGLISCSKKPSDHDVRVAAKKIIRKELKTSSTSFAPDDKIKITREDDNKTFNISIYSDAQNASGKMIRKNWNLHLFYKGGSLTDIKNWNVLKNNNQAPD